MFLDAAGFPFVPVLRGAWRDVRQELEQLAPSGFVDWPETALYDKGWEVFGFYAFGVRLSTQCERCPRTAALLDRVVGVTTAGFSLLRPGTHIRPHRGYSSAVLRCHLGLIVPDGCSLRVGDDTRSWEEGDCLVFDDTTEHEVWHRGNRPRVVLLLDIARGALETR